MTNWWCYHRGARSLIAMMSCTFLRWLAGRLGEAISQAVALWMLDTCNTEPPIQRSGRARNTQAALRFATGF